MRVLIDTHIFLWFINDDPKLSATTKALLQSEANVMVSVASLWEIAIKISLGKLILPGSIEVLFPEQLRLNNIALLPIDIQHLKTMSTLPFHHRDPFDRLIIAQAIVEEAGLVSMDQVFEQYDVNLIRSLR